MKNQEILFQETAPLLIDKPLTWTSFDVVKKLRGLLKVKKIGHAGTLDPLATGLLLLCIGKGTKQLAQYQGLDKTYEGELVLGRTTPSFDLETPFEQMTSYDHLQREEIFSATEVFKGAQEQVPPAYSACKVDGTRAYKKARQGKEVSLSKRQVTIHQFDILSCELPVVRFLVTCSKGTYIRTLAHDFGQHLGVGAYLSALRRTSIGPYHVEDAYTIPFLAEKRKEGALGVSLGGQRP